MNPEVSVIVPFYNCQDCIGACLDSIKKQTFQNFEVLLINDGSTDSSEKIVNTVIETDQRFKYFLTENRGVSAARNLGLKNAKAPLIMFVDADDLLCPDHFEKLVYEIRISKADLVIGSYLKISDEQSIEYRMPPLSKQSVNLIWREFNSRQDQFGYVWNKCFKKEIIDRYKISFNEDKYSQEDLSFCLDYYEKIKTVSLLNDITYNYNFSDGKREPDFYTIVENKLRIYSKLSEKNENLQNEKSYIINQIYQTIYAWTLNSASVSDSLNRFFILADRYHFYYEKGCLDMSYTKICIHFLRRKSKLLYSVLVFIRKFLISIGS